jgi:isopentenyldiphosphate isomerase
MPDSELLEVVDDNDHVVGLETRVKIHAEGLLHRDVHVWFITPRGEVVFQHRAKDKDTWPDKLDATVGGHAEPGMSYRETAIKECLEETGVAIEIDKLVFIAKVRKSSADPVTKTRNENWRELYIYFYTGRIEDLHVEQGKALGFEAWPIESLFNISTDDRIKFIPACLEPDTLEIFQKAKEIFKLK